MALTRFSISAQAAEVTAKGFAHRAGNVAHVLSTSEHTALPGGPVQGRSIDSLELFFDGSRWWISGANIWDVESRNRPLPREFMP
jgi:hypothetical protein